MRAEFRPWEFWDRHLPRLLLSALSGSISPRTLAEGGSAESGTPVRVPSKENWQEPHLLGFFLTNQDTHRVLVCS